MLVALGPDSFSRPMPTAGAVAVVDLTRNRLLTFDLKGNQLAALDLPASADPASIMRGEDGRLYVAHAPTVTAARNAAGDTATVRWTTPDLEGGELAGYEVVAGPAGGTSTVTGTTRQFTGLDPASAYTFSVQPVTHEQGRNGGPTTRGAPGTATVDAVAAVKRTAQITSTTTRVAATRAQGSGQQVTTIWIDVTMNFDYDPTGTIPASGCAVVLSSAARGLSFRKEFVPTMGTVSTSKAVGVATDWQAELDCGQTNTSRVAVAYPPTG